MERAKWVKERWVWQESRTEQAKVSGRWALARPLPLCPGPLGSPRKGPARLLQPLCNTMNPLLKPEFSVLIVTGLTKVFRVEQGNSKPGKGKGRSQEPRRASLRRCTIRIPTDEEMGTI